MIYGALDLAKQSGVCWGDPNGKPEFETWLLGGQSLQRGFRGANLMSNLVAWIAYAKPDKVFIEAPLSLAGQRRKHSNQDTNIALIGYIMIAETVCHTRNIPTELLERQDVLLHFTGSARYRVPGQAKKNCMMRALQLRWTPANEDEADAGALWHYGVSLEDRGAFLKRAKSEPVMHSRRRLL